MPGVVTLQYGLQNVCRLECDVRCILYAGIGIQYHLVG
jgi:hypothetical protein